MYAQGQDGQGMQTLSGGRAGGGARACAPPLAPNCSQARQLLSLPTL